MKSSVEMRVLRMAAVLLCSAGLALSPAMAQQGGPPPDGQMQGPPGGQMQGPPQGGHWRHGPDSARRVEMLQRRLGLSQDQTSQVRAILAGERTKMEALRSNSSMTRQDRRAQMMAIRQDGEAQIQAVLTTDQKAKYSEMQARQRQRMEQRRDQGGYGSDGSAPPPPPPPPQ